MDQDATIVSRTFDVVHIAYVKGEGGAVEAGRVYVRDELDHGYWYIHGLIVKQAYREQGIGRQLMADVLAAYPVERIELVPSVEDATGMTYEVLEAWYRRLGFRPGPSANAARRPRESDARRMFRAGVRES